MRIALIVACSDNQVIGKDNQLPWHLPNDLKHFKTLTTGKAILMGRKTYESIGRPLPNRRNIVLTTNQAFQAEGVEVVHNVQEALSLAKKIDEMMVIGGAEIYALFLPFAKKLYLTKVHTSIEGDAYFPEIDFFQWNRDEQSFHEKDAQHAFSYTYETYTLKE